MALLHRGKTGTKEEALNIYKKLREELQLPLYVDDKTAVVDFHWARSSIVFVPSKETLTTVKNKELLEFLKKAGVKKVVLDNMYPSHVELMKALCEAGLEVEAISRPTAQEEFRAYVRRKVEALKKAGFNIDIELDKNDYNDAVITAFIYPKYRRTIDIKFLNCWPYMTLWRRARRLHKALRQLLKATAPSIKKRLQQLIQAIMPTRKMSPTKFDEMRLEAFAESFVEVVLRNYPEYRLMGLFERLRIVDDVIKQAHVCEVFVEMLGFRSRQKFLNKAGIRMVRNPSDKPLICDRALRDALMQAAIKVYHIPITQRRIIKIRAIRLAEEVFSWMKEAETKNLEDGRVEETRVTGPSQEEREFEVFSPVKGPCESRSNPETPGARALNTRPY
jgi:hypothetical protein